MLLHSLPLSAVLLLRALLLMPLSECMSRQRYTILAFILVNFIVLFHLYTTLLDRNASALSLQPPPTSPAALSINEPIVFALVMFGAASAKEGLIAIKSALMYASRPVDFHIITSHDGIPVLEAKLKLITRPPYPINVFYYPLEADAIRKRAVRAGVDTKYGAGMGGLVKIFIHEVLPSTVSKAIFFDTDMIFITDPYLLWRRFDSFVPPQMISFPDLGTDATAMEICTCAMLLHLDAMRIIERPFISSTLFPKESRPLGTVPLFRNSGIDPHSPEFGDQGLFWAIWKKYRQYFVHLPLVWDISHCQFSYGLTLEGDDDITEQEQTDEQIRTKNAEEQFPQLFPAILHFNCQPAFDVIWENPENKQRTRWASFVNLSIDYKWIWLNKGDGTSHITTSTVNNTIFWDEQISSSLKYSQKYRHNAHLHHNTYRNTV